MHILPQSKAQVQEELQLASADLEQALAPLTDEQMTDLRDAAGWTIQDHLNHLAVWEESAALVLERCPRAERFAAMGVDFATVENLSEDEENALIRERTPSRTLAETRAALRTAHEHLLSALEPLSDADLERSYSHYQSEVGTDSGRPIVAWIVGNSSEHYREHLPWIQAIARPCLVFVQK